MKTTPVRFRAAQSAALALLLGHAVAAQAAGAYTITSGSQFGVTAWDASLNPVGSFGTPFVASAVGAGHADDLYLASANGLYHYGASGNVLGSFTFPDAGIRYTGVSVGGDDVLFSYKGSQQGISVRDRDLVQSFAFNIGVDINGIAAGDRDDVFVATDGHLADYGFNGTILASVDLPGTDYTGVSYRSGTLVAASTGAQQGFTVRNASLGQIDFVPTAFAIGGIALGTSGDVLLTSGNRLYDYALNGTLLHEATFSDPGAVLRGVAAPVPEPSSLAVLGVAGAAALRRRSRRG